MPKIVDRFRDDHERALDHLGDLVHYVAQLREGRPMGQLIDGFKAFSDFLGEALKEHFRQEEEALFPALRPLFGGSGGPVAQMLREHEQIEEAHARMVAELAKENPDRHALADAAQTILDVLPAHVEKEDNVLFPFAERRLTPEQSTEIDGLAGWTVAEQGERPGKGRDEQGPSI